MPNYIANEILFKGTKKELDLVVEVCKDMDFQAIIPQPKELDIESGTASMLAIGLLLYDTFGTNSPEGREDLTEREKMILKLYPSYKDLNDYSEFVSNAVKRVMEYPLYGEITEDTPYGEPSNDLSYFYSSDSAVSRFPKCQADFLEFGKIILSNLEKFGAKDWYDWRITNWGTKWSAMDFQKRRTDDTLNYFFHTANSCPDGIIEYIGEKISHTGIEMSWKYADEDIGSNCGEFIKESNSNVIDYIDYEGDEEFACEVMGLDYQEYLEDNVDDED